MTDNEIIKALDCCLDASPSTCKKCPLFNVTSSTMICSKIAIKFALDLIKRQKSEIKELDENVVIQKGLIDLQKVEIERLQDIGDNKTKEILRHDAFIKELHNKLKAAKAEAYKEFAEKLHEELRMYGTKDKFNKVVFLNVVDRAKKELVGDNE